MRDGLGISGGMEGGVGRGYWQCWLVSRAPAYQSLSGLLGMNAEAHSNYVDTEQMGRGV